MIKLLGDVILMLCVLILNWRQEKLRQLVQNLQIENADLSRRLRESLDASARALFLEIEEYEDGE